MNTAIVASGNNAKKREREKTNILFCNLRRCFEDRNDSRVVPHKEVVRSAPLRVIRAAALLCVGTWPPLDPRVAGGEVRTQRLLLGVEVRGEDLVDRRVHACSASLVHLFPLFSGRQSSGLLLLLLVLDLVRVLCARVAIAEEEKQKKFNSSKSSIIPNRN